MATLPLPCLCLVTDRHQCEGRRLEDVVEAAVEGGANMVQLREKDLTAERLFTLARVMRELTRGKALLFINGRLDVALACDADGVQLGEEGLPVDAARQVAGERVLMGRSVHSVEGALEAEAKGADLLVVGTIFPTGSHSGSGPDGIGQLEQVSSRVHIPFLAIGGVTAKNVESVITAGASGAAVITAITRSQDPARATRELTERMKEAWASRARRGVAGPA